MFGSTLAGRPVKVADQMDTLKYIINYDSIPPKLLFHLSIFILPNVNFDPEYTALIYYQFQDNELPTSDFKLLGGLSTLKQSAIFKINSGNTSGLLQQSLSTNQEGDIDMDTDTGADSNNTTNSSNTSLVIGISIEPNQIALPQLNQLKLQHQQKTLPAPSITTTAPIPTITLSTLDIPLTKEQIESISNKIIKNAYNYLSSFVDDKNNVSISKFDLWWNRFKAKISNDPKFLDNLN